MEHRLIQQTSQKLVLSPQIRQYLKLLQMNSTELEQAVDAFLTENPMIEVKVQEIKAEDAQPEVLKERAPSADELDFVKGPDLEALQDLEDRLGSAAEVRGPRLQDAQSLQQIRDFQEMIVTQSESLEDALLQQIRMLDLNEDEFEAASHLVGDLDTRGYLSSSLEELAERTGWTVERIQALLFKLQELEPAGIFARDLQECLILQLRRMKPCPELAIRMVSECFGVLARHDWPAMARSLKVSLESVREAASIVMKLEPRPSREFSAESAQSVVPDLIISPDDEEEGKFKVELTEEFAPRLQISRTYRKLLRDPATDEETRKFIREKIQLATQFISGLELRGSTLKNVAEFVVRNQTEFLTHGFSHLKPLRMKDAAEALGLHESSISRAVSGKYVATPQGTLALRKFFSNRLEMNEGDPESQRSVMARIEKMIAAEDPAKPLSDQAIVDILKAEGYQIARRTVAKYRDLLKILPTHLRRKR